jgi:hypothetical protein
MAEVRGSSPLGSTPFLSLFAGKTQQFTDRPADLPALFDDSLTTVGATLGEYVFHRTRGMVSYPWNHVGIGVQRDRHCGMAQKLLDVFGMYITAQ